MNITLRYETGIEVFDTAERLDAAAHRGNVLANWALDLEDARQGDGLPDDPQGKRLWLHLYTHAMPENAMPAIPGTPGTPGTPAPAAQQLSPRGLPVAPRHDAASFLLADEHDLDRLLEVTVNAEPVLVRIGDELVNASRLACAMRAASIHAPQAVYTRHRLEAALGDEIEGDPELEICKLMGLTPSSYAALERLQPDA